MSKVVGILVVVNVQVVVDDDRIFVTHVDIDPIAVPGT